MGDNAVRDTIRSQIHTVDATALLPHHRRSALLVLDPTVDLLDAAVTIAKNDTAAVAALIEAGTLARPSLSDLADWCVDTELRFQFAIVQPYVLAQRLPKPHTPDADASTDMAN